MSAPASGLFARPPSRLRTRRPACLDVGHRRFSFAARSLVRADRRASSRRRDAMPTRQDGRSNLRLPPGRRRSSGRVASHTTGRRFTPVPAVGTNPRSPGCMTDGRTARRMDRGMDRRRGRGARRRRRRLGPVHRGWFRRRDARSRNAIDDAFLAAVAISRGATLASFDQILEPFVEHGLRWGEASHLIRRAVAASARPASGFTRVVAPGAIVPSRPPSRWTNPGRGSEFSAWCPLPPSLKRQFAADTRTSRSPR